MSLLLKLGFSSGRDQQPEALRTTPQKHNFEDKPITKYNLVTRKTRFPPSTSSDRSNSSNPSNLLPTPATNHQPLTTSQVYAPFYLAPANWHQSSSLKKNFPPTQPTARQELTPPAPRNHPPQPAPISPRSTHLPVHIYGRPHHETTPPSTLCVRHVRHVVLVFCVLCGYTLFAPPAPGSSDLRPQTPDPLSSDPRPQTLFLQTRNPEPGTRPFLLSTRFPLEPDRIAPHSASAVFLNPIPPMTYQESPPKQTVYSGH
jgi:hypothetical protein